MDITKFDKNFAAAAVEKDGKRRFDLPCAPFKLYGGMYEEGEGFVRMPLGVAAGVSAGVHFLAGNGAGLRLNFRTNSKTLRLYVRESFFCRMRHMALTGSTGFILCSREGAEKKSVFRGVLCPEWNFGDEFEVAVNRSIKTCRPCCITVLRLRRAAALRGRILLTKISFASGRVQTISISVFRATARRKTIW